MGWLYLVAAVGLGAPFVWHALRLCCGRGRRPRRHGLFRYSISYLALLFAAVAVDALVYLPI